MMQTEGPVLTQSFTNLCYVFIAGQKSTEYANAKKKSSCFGKIHHFSIYNYTPRAFYAQPHLSWIFCIIRTVSGDICRAHLLQLYRVSVFPLLNVVCTLGEVPDSSRKRRHCKKTTEALAPFLKWLPNPCEK